MAFFVAFDSSLLSTVLTVLSSGVVKTGGGSGGNGAGGGVDGGGVDGDDAIVSVDCCCD